MAVSQSEHRLLQRKADKYDEFRARIDSYHAVWSALDGVIEAWESLPGGQHHSEEAVAAWLAKKMAPAIQRGRTALGRRRPDGD